VGKTYQQTEYYLSNDDGIFLEIGSTREENSSEYFAKVAKKHNSKFISVDIDADCSNRFTSDIDVEFYSMSGSEFAEKILPTLGVKVKCLYLDNMDWIWTPLNLPLWMQEQIDWYRQNFNIKLTNLSSQAEHLKQMIFILPHMAEKSVIVCDDTYKIPEQTYTGKCGAVIPLLIDHGYQIVYEDEYQAGLILRNFKVDNNE